MLKWLVLGVKFENKLKSVIAKKGIKFVSMRLITIKNQLILSTNITKILENEKDGLSAIWEKENEGCIRIGSEERFRLSLFSHLEIDEKKESGKEIAAHYYRGKKKKKKMIKKKKIQKIFYIFFFFF